MSRTSCSLPPALIQLQDLLDAAGPAAKALSSRGIPVLGYTCPALPEELPHALGLHPVRLLLSLDADQPAGGPPVETCCAWEQRLLDQAAAGRFGHLWGVVFSCNTCDAMRNLSERWTRHVKQPGVEKLFDLIMPLSRDGEGSWDEMDEDLQRFKGWLERRLGRGLKAGALESSAALFNRIRGALRGLQAATRAGRLPAGAHLSATIAAQTVQREAAADLLELALDQLRQEPVTARPPESRPRIMVLGGPLDSPRLLEWLDRMPAVLVEDDSCSFSSYFVDSSDLSDVRPWQDLSVRHRRKADFSSAGQSSPRRLARMIELVVSRGVDGVVFIPIKGCDPQAFDNQLLRRALDERRVPHLTLEVAPAPGGVHQLKERMDHFFDELQQTM